MIMIMLIVHWNIHPIFLLLGFEISYKNTLNSHRFINYLPYENIYHNKFFMYFEIIIYVSNILLIVIYYAYYKSNSTKHLIYI